MSFDLSWKTYKNLFYLSIVVKFNFVQGKIYPYFVKRPRLAQDLLFGCILSDAFFVSFHCQLVPSLRFWHFFHFFSVSDSNWSPLSLWYLPCLPSKTWLDGISRLYIEYTYIECLFIEFHIDPMHLHQIILISFPWIIPSPLSLGPKIHPLGVGIQVDLPYIWSMCILMLRHSM